MDDVVMAVLSVLGCLYATWVWLSAERRHRRGEELGVYRGRHEHKARHRG